MKKMNASFSIHGLRKLVFKMFILGAFLFSGLNVSAQVSNDQAVVILTQEAESFNPILKAVETGQQPVDEAALLARTKQSYYNQVKESILGGSGLQDAVDSNLPAGLPSIDAATGLAVFESDKTGLNALKAATEALLGL